MSITLSELRLRSRQKADRETSNFVENEELDFMINSSIAELHDLLVAANASDYSISEYDFTTTTSQNSYALPADFYKLKGVDVKITGDDWQTLRPYNFNERNRNNNTTWGKITMPWIRYRLLGNNIVFSPIPDAETPVRLFYTPLALKLVDDSDTLQDLNSYSEYVIVDVAIKYLQKEESDVSILMQQKNELKRRIEVMANNRDEGHADTISDIYAENSDFWIRRS